MKQFAFKSDIFKKINYLLIASGSFTPSVQKHALYKVHFLFESWEFTSLSAEFLRGNGFDILKGLKTLRTKFSIWRKYTVWYQIGNTSPIFKCVFYRFVVFEVSIFICNI